MRRLVAGSLAFIAITTTLLVVPVYAAPQPEPQAVETATEEVAMGSVADPAPSAEVQEGTSEPVAGVPDAAPTLTVRATDVETFSLVGVTWAYDEAVTDVAVQIRVQDSAGRWGAWTTVATEDVDQDAGTDSGADLRGGTAPLWTGPGTGVEAELVTRRGAAPDDVRLNLVDPGSSPADSSLGTPAAQATAEASLAMPAIYSRAQWGADEGIRSWDPEYAPTLRAAVIHHTADSNNYTADQVPAIMRSIYKYHTVSRGWGDIGYNVIVDKFGRAWEGRYGGLATTVVGAHTGGFNSGTFGISMLGNYELVNPPQALVNTVAAVLAWKLSLYGVDPRGTVTLTSGGGGTSKYAAGVRVTLPTVFGHRDVGNTTCPGQYGYARLGEVRDRVTAAMATDLTIAGRYAADPALRNLLGAPGGGEQATGGVTWQAYANGIMYSSPATGVRFVTGAVLATYLAAGGPAALGAPTTDELPAPDGIGRFNQFSGSASIYWTQPTGAHLVHGAIRDLWAAQGWERGPLGYPTAGETSAPDGVQFSTFQRGTAYWTARTGARAVLGGIAQRWNSLGGLSWGWGVPTTNELPTADGVGRFNHFSGGASIYWSPTTGARAVQGAIRYLWSTMGWERGQLGYPTSDEILAADGRTRFSTFQNGVIYWTPDDGPRALAGAIAQRWNALGGLLWGWGVPTTNELPTADGVGRFNHFSGGASIYWSRTTGARAVQGAIRHRWSTVGWERSRLGYPTSDEYSIPGGRRSDFQGGTISWDAQTGATTVAFR